MSKAGNKIILASFCILLMAMSFYAGVIWKGETLGCSEKYETITPLEAQTSSGEIGVIPKGTVLYNYYIPFSDVDTYYIFIDLKRQNALSMYKGEQKFNLIVPLDAYIPD